MNIINVWKQHLEIRQSFFNPKKTWDDPSSSLSKNPNKMEEIFNWHGWVSTNKYSQKITQNKQITTPVTEICLSWLMLNPLPLVSHFARHLLGKTAANHGLFCLLRHNPNRDSHLHFVDLNFELLQGRWQTSLGFGGKICHEVRWGSQRKGCVCECACWDVLPVLSNWVISPLYK